MITLLSHSVSGTELVQIPCSRDDITATQHLTSPLRDSVHACDGNTDSFYHSEQVESWEKASPFFTVKLDSTSRIKTITVVNVHTGGYCEWNAKDCTLRIDGAKVEVLDAGKEQFNLQLSYYVLNVRSMMFLLKRFRD